VNKKVLSLCKRVHKESSKLEGIDFSKKTNKELVSVFQSLCSLIEELNSWGQLVSLLEYGPNNYSTQGLLKHLEKQNKKLALNKNPAEVLGILSSPIKKTIFGESRIALLKLALEAKKKGLRKKTVQQKIEEFLQKYRWINYGYEGPVISKESVLKEVKVFKKKKDLEKELNQKVKEISLLKRKQAALEKEFKLNPFFRQRFAQVREFTFQKNLRKDVSFHAFFVLELIHRELSKRTGLSVSQLRYLLPSELSKAFKEKNLGQLLNERKNFCVYSVSKNKEEVLIGKKAERIAKKLQKGIGLIEEVNELKGTCSFPGKVKGKAKIVLGVSHLQKLKKGNILVSHSTNPQMVPAMKKVKAVVTEQGGVVSHAAIISRELKIPCITGVKNATIALKDNDLIEVNATKGVIRKVRK
jgi:phosphohistidine swiveling domain-containing protein